jgi:hypothetical protein
MCHFPIQGVPLCDSALFSCYRDAYSSCPFSRSIDINETRSVSINRKTRGPLSRRHCHRQDMRCFFALTSIMCSSTIHIRSRWSVTIVLIWPYGVCNTAACFSWTVCMHVGFLIKACDGEASNMEVKSVHVLQSLLHETLSPTFHISCCCLHLHEANLINCLWCREHL